MDINEIMVLGLFSNRAVGVKVLKVLQEYIQKCTKVLTDFQ